MPTLIDWCASAAAHLPAASTGNFPGYLRRMATDHETTIAALTGGPLESRIQPLSGLTRALGDAIADAVDAYLDGHPDRAYACLCRAIAPVRAHVDDLHTSSAGNPLPHVYRMRTSAAPQGFTRHQIFHIPFERRGLVSPQRFSIPGLPCLYLGGSSYVCWEELGRPAFSSSYIAQFRFVDHSVRLLDLAYVPRFLPLIIALWQANGPNMARYENFLVASAVCWPLLAACMTRTHEPQAAFKPEYIVPQLLLQWVTQETNLIGIRYFSTRVGNPRTPTIGANLVIPARVMAPSGLCSRLTSLFEVTPVWNWEVAGAVNVPMLSSRNGGEIEAAPGAFVDYIGTQFWRIESVLSEQTSARL